MASGGPTGSEGPKARVILQQCMSAKLQVETETDDQPAQYVKVTNIVQFKCIYFKFMLCDNLNLLFL